MPHKQYRWVYDLPEELWINIFSYTTIPLWWLGQICHHLRQIALYNPLLWNRLPPLHIEPHNNGSMKEYLSELLSRSTDAPLFLHITMDFEVEEEPNEVLALLLHHSKRWKQATLRQFTTEHIQAQSVVTDIQFLQLLSIDFQVETSPITFLRHAPELRHIRVWYSDKSPAVLDIPWSQIESYEQLGGLRETFQNVLQVSPHLRTLTFRERSLLTNPSELPLHMCTHSKLRQLTVWCAHGSQTLTSFFQTLTLPALEELTISSLLTYSTNVQLLQTLILFVHRSKCSLVKLGLLLTYIPVVQTVQLLQETPHVRELNIRTCDTQYSSTLCSKLRHVTEKATLVPWLSFMNLELVDRSNAHENPFDITRMAQMVFSRSNVAVGAGSTVMVQPLASVHISGLFRNYAFPFRCQLEGVDPVVSKSMSMGDIIQPTRMSQRVDTKPAVRELVRNLVNSEAMRKQYSFQHMFCILDLIHLTFMGSKEKSYMLKQLEEHKLISQLDDKLHLRKWIFVGSELIYIPPNHRIRNTLHRWLLVMGIGYFLDVPYLMGRELYPSHTPECLRIVEV